MSNFLKTWKSSPSESYLEWMIRLALSTTRYNLIVNLIHMFTKFSSTTWWAQPYFFLSRVSGIRLNKTDFNCIFFKGHWRPDSTNFVMNRNMYVRWSIGISCKPQHLTKLDLLFLYMVHFIKKYNYILT